jgi:hypothetical protein
VTVLVGGGACAVTVADSGPRVALIDLSTTVQVGDNGASVVVRAPGPQGPPGAGVVEASDFLHVSARLGEFTTSQARIEARQNLELQYIDGGEF